MDSYIVIKQSDCYTIDYKKWVDDNKSMLNLLWCANILMGRRDNTDSLLTAATWHWSSLYHREKIKERVDHCGAEIHAVFCGADF